MDVIWFLCLFLFYVKSGVLGAQWWSWHWWKWITTSCLCLSWKETRLSASQEGWCNECTGMLFSPWIHFYPRRFIHLFHANHTPFTGGQIRVSAVLTNGAYLLNVDCDHYFNSSKALREAMCFMMDPALGRKTCYVQFPQRFDGIDLHDRYANRNIVFFDVSIVDWWFLL
jgi:hypothetical protein